MNFRVVNIVSTFNINCKVNLKDIALRALNTEYNPKRFPALIIRIRNPNYTCSLFPFGKIVMLGGKHENESILAAKRITKMIKKLGYHNVKINNYKIQNIVATFDYGKKINLTMLNTLMPNSIYEPELFPGLKFGFLEKKENENVFAIIFNSGKINIVGLKSKKSAIDKFNILVLTLNNLQKIIC